MDAALRKTSTLIVKDLRDIVKNPYMLLCCLMPIGFMLLYSNMTGGEAAGDPAAATQITGFLLSTALCMTVGLTGTMLVLYAIAEEKEKHTLRTLMLANVNARHVMASRSVVALAVIVVVDAACFMVVGAPADVFVPYLLIGLVGSIPIVLVSLLLGLAARDQMTAGLYSTPVVFVAIAPMFAMANETAAKVIGYLPTGGMDQLAKLAVAGNLFTSDAVVPALVTLGWIVVALVAFALLYKRLARDN